METAADSVMTTLTPEVLVDLEPALSDAVDRGTTVVLLVYDVDPGVEWLREYDFAPVATVVIMGKRED